MEKLRNLITQRDFNRPALAILVDLIKIYCGYDVSLPHTRFGTPFPLDIRPDITDDVNTFVPAQIDESWDDSFPGSNGFVYYRLPIDLLNGSAGITVDLSGLMLPLSVHQALAHINLACGTQLSRDDVEDTPLASLSAPVQLRAKASSLVWANVVLPALGPLDLQAQTVLELPGLQYTYEIQA